MKRLISSLTCMVIAAAICIPAAAFTAADSINNPDNPGLTTDNPADTIEPADSVSDTDETGNSEWDAASSLNGDSSGDINETEDSDSDGAASPDNGDSDSTAAPDDGDSDGTAAPDNGNLDAGEIPADITVPEIPDAESVDFSSGQPTVLIDNEYCTITLTSMEMQDNDFWAEYAAGLTIENKTDTTLSLTVSHCSVNGKMCEPLYNEKIEPSDTIESSLAISDIDLNRSFITEVTDLQFTFTCREEADPFNDLFLATFDLYPSGIDAGEAAEPDHPDSYVILDNDIVKITVIEITEDDDHFNILARFDNKTDNNILILPTEDTKINGTELRPFFNCKVDAGKSCYSDISWFGLADIDIEKVETAELGLDILNGDNMNADSYYNDVITINIQ